MLLIASSHEKLSKHDGKRDASLTLPPCPSCLHLPGRAGLDRLNGSGTRRCLLTQTNTFTTGSCASKLPAANGEQFQQPGRTAVDTAGLQKVHCAATVS